MSVTQPQEHPIYLERPPSADLRDAIEAILDKGMVIDGYVRVSLVGLEILTVDLRAVIASVDTYLKFAEAMERCTQD
ncbi:gas vesicle protein GvpJ [Sinomonas sp.]|uniref:gas vesicle protein GvpJ n=1 Tax=Sinomonas sp. TaxID=1914986 RepID=UPI003F7CD9CB